MTHLFGTVLLAAAVATPAGYRGTEPGQGTLAGSFAVSNPLPEGASLKAVLLKSDGGAPMASLEAVVLDGAIAFSFAGLADGVYRVRLVAARGGKDMALATTGDVELTKDAPRKDGVRAAAVGTDGSISGTLRATGVAPKGRLVFVSARRTDITHKSPMTDSVNHASFEVSPEEFASGQVDYKFSGLSYGIFHIQLTTYNFTTHATEGHGAYVSEIVVDLDHKNHAGKDFKGGFVAKP